MRSLLLGALIMAGCTGSPDAVTVYGGRGTALYDNAAGARAFDEVGYSYGLALTWNLPSTRTALRDERELAVLDALRSIQASEHDQLLLHYGEKPTSVTVEPATVELPPGFDEPKKDDLSTTAKAALWGSLAALAATVAEVLRRRTVKNAEKIEAIDKAKTPQA